MTFTLPVLTYDYAALEPHIDAKTMEIHHSKHHQAYVNNLNAALENSPELQEKSIEDIIKGIQNVPEAIRTAVRNNGGGHLNHSFFWTLLKPGGGDEPTGTILDAINETFGNVASFKETFTKAATTRFGSGWAWLSLDTSKKLVVSSTANQDNPISDGLVPLLALDVWEHAYYLTYQNRRPDYITAWWNVVNWEQVRTIYEANV